MTRTQLLGLFYKLTNRLDRENDSFKSDLRDPQNSGTGKEIQENK